MEIQIHPQPLDNKRHLMHFDRGDLFTFDNPNGVTHADDFPKDRIFLKVTNEFAKEDRTKLKHPRVYAVNMKSFLVVQFSPYEKAYSISGELALFIVEHPDPHATAKLPKTALPIRPTEDEDEEEGD